jgi:hypothetical protein
VDAILAAASAALGTLLSEPADLGGSKASTVLRCRAASGGTVIVKSYPQTLAGAHSFAAEASGLAFAAGTGAGPGLLAADPAATLIVMADLGTAPSLADVLLGGSAAAARAALLSWSLACGRLAVQTAGRQQQLALLRAAYLDGTAPGRSAGQLVQGAGQSTVPGASADQGQSAVPGASLGAGHWLRDRVMSVPGLIGVLDVVPPAGLADDLAAVAAITEPGCYEVFSPGDICPDNNLLTPAGTRFIDYEAAEFHSAFLDAAYLRMPFSTCWCVFRLPGDLAAAAEASYRAQVSGIYPDLAADAAWRPGVLRAVAAWTLHGMCHLLDRSVVADWPMDDFRRPVPTARQLLRYRWQRLGRELASAAELPALASLMQSLLTATEQWQVPDLPAYPAFAAGG